MFKKSETYSYSLWVCLKAVSIVFMAIWAAFFTLVFPERVWASKLVVDCRETVSIEAEGVTREDILKALADKIGFSIDAQGLLTETVSLSMEGASFEACLRRVLGRVNHVVVYEETPDGRTVPEWLRVYGASHGNAFKYTPKPASKESALVEIDPTKGIDSKWLAKSLRETKNLSSQISGDGLAQEPPDPGFRVTRVMKDSFFHEIGLREGDIVEDVNGRPVRTVRDFIGALTTLSKKNTTIHIERLDKNNIIKPIYIESQESAREN